MRSTNSLHGWRLATWAGSALLVVGLAAWPLWSQVPAPATPDAPKTPDVKVPDVKPDQNPDKPGDLPAAEPKPRDPNTNPRTPRDPAERREDRRDAAEDRRESADDRRDDRRDATTDRREDRRDDRGDRRPGLRGEFRASDIRSADVGIWFNRNTQNGLVINSVNTSGAISKLGFREGDRIISVNGRKVARDADFTNYLFADDIRRQKVKVVVFRGGQEQEVLVEPHLLVEDYTTTYSQTDPLEEFGIILDDRTTDRIVVWRVVPRSPAFYAGIRAGDVLVTLHSQKLTNAQQVATVVGKLETGAIPVQVLRNRQTVDLEVDYKAGAGAGRRTALRPNIDGRDNENDVDRANPRREDRIEDRQDRREDVREGRVPDNDSNPDAPALQPGTARQPSYQQPQPRRRWFRR